LVVCPNLGVCQTLGFETDLRQQILRYLPVSDAEHESAVANFEIGELLARFLMWRERLVHPHPRSVHKSPQLFRHPIYEARREDIHRLFAKVVVGQDIGAHLSRNIQFGYVTPASGKKGGRDIDGLLNDWSIHHLHLSHAIEGDGFVERGKQVLAVIFRQDDAYFIDIIDHGEWAEQRLVEIAVANWPNAGLFIELKGLLGGDSYTSKERARLREVGMPSPVMIQGRPYIPANGMISTALIPVRVTVQAGRLLRQLMTLEASPGLLLPGFRAAEGFSRKTWPRKPRYRVIAAITPDRYSFAIREETAGLVHGLTT
jgi:hypothetical protein